MFDPFLDLDVDIYADITSKEKNKDIEFKDSVNVQNSLVIISLQ